MDKHISMPINITYISFFLLLVIIITTFFPHQSHSQSQPPQPQPQPVYNYSSCRDINHSYNCGRITDISYPFWGQNRRSYCGAGHHFYLNCDEKNTTTIVISSQNFTVVDIDPTTHTMKLKRTDLDQNVCSPQYDDTYLFPPPFHYLPTLKNITIFYNCTLTPISPENPICESPNKAFYTVGDEDKPLEESRNCKRHIHVPLGKDFPVVKDYNDYFDHEVLKNGLDKGFELNYNLKEECLICLGSEEGDCRWKKNSDIEKHVKSTCYYDDCLDGSVHPSTQHCCNHKSMFSYLFISNKEISVFGNGHTAALQFLVL